MMGVLLSRGAVTLRRAIGIGVIIGVCIFTRTGRAAHELAGPSITLSFIVVSVCCTGAGRRSLIKTPSTVTARC